MARYKIEIDDGLGNFFHTEVDAENEEEADGKARDQISAQSPDSERDMMVIITIELAD